jgi:hypothetical protein
MSGLKRVSVVRNPSWERDTANAVNFMLRHTEPLNRTAATLDIADTINLASGKVYEINGVQVVGPRVTGWTASTGTPSRGVFSAAAAGTASASYAQAELQGALNRIAALEARLIALEADMRAHGLIGA